ncbi:flavodoxin family protein [bacterium]|nr:flavodoxin family protein [bacterium]
MIKVAVLYGSPHINGNSSILSQHFLDGLGAVSEVQTNLFYLNGMDIKPCQGCLHCKTSENHRCKIEDDMYRIYEAHAEADIVVFASPMYWGYLTAQMKTAIDRMEALAWNYFGGRTFVVLLTYHYHCESTVAFFERISPFFKIDLHIITCRTLNEKTREDIRIANLKGKLDEAYQLGEKLASKFI